MRRTEERERESSGSKSVPTLCAGMNSRKKLERVAQKKPNQPKVEWATKVTTTTIRQ